MTSDHKRLFIGTLRQIDCVGRKSPLRGMLVDVFHVTLDANDSPTFTKLTTAASKTDDYGLFYFYFTDPSETDAFEPAADARHESDDASRHPSDADEPETTPSDEQEDLAEFQKRYPSIFNQGGPDGAITNSSTATAGSSGGQGRVRRLAFAYKVTALMETDEAIREADASPPPMLMEVMDERYEPSRDWGRTVKSRSVILPENSRFIFRRVFIPASNADAARLTDDNASRVTNLSPQKRGNAFAFLGVGRATWDEIGGFAETRPQFIGKTGYFRSANTWDSNPDNIQGLLPNRYDAPFAGWLSIMGVFRGDLADKPLFYSVTLSRYAGDTSKPFDPALLTNPRSPRYSCYAYFFEYSSPTSTEGRWKSEKLGPYTGSIDGKPVAVFRRRLPRPATVEYWPSPEILADLYTTTDFDDGLWVVTIRAFEQTGGSATTPTLQEVAIDQAPRAVMPLMIDSNRPRVRFDKLYPNDATSYVKLRLVSCTWGSGGEQYTPIADVTECNEIGVNPGQVGGNEGILIRFTICDKKGLPHKHWKEYKLTAEYTPRSTSDSPDKTRLLLRRSFAGTGPLDQQYNLLKPIPSDPTTPISERECILVPSRDDGWPPEKGDPHATPCLQYGVGLQLEVYTRQIDGCWDTFYESERTARYIVLRNAQARCT